MNESIGYILYLVPILIIMLILQIVTPKITRKNILFGVKVPIDKSSSSEIQKIYREYVRYNILFGGLFILLFTIGIVNLKYKFAWYMTGLLLFILLTFIIYYKANVKVKKLKSKEGWSNGNKGIVIIDTEFSRNKNNKTLTSPFWFLIPIAIIAINILIGISAYPTIPNKLPMHYDFAGNVTDWANKSPGVIWLMPCVQLGMTFIMFFSYKIIGWSKQQIDASNPQESKERNTAFRVIWSKYMIFMNIVVNLLFTFAHLNILTILKCNGITIAIVNMLLVGLILASTIILSIKTGQGGSNLKMHNKKASSVDVHERDDDKFWKLGSTIYVNKDDPALFVEKRFGVGWTMNFGRIESIVILVGFFIVLFLIMFFSSKLS